MTEWEINIYKKINDKKIKRFDRWKNWLILIKKFNDEKFLYARQIECYMGIQTFNQLYVFNILQPIYSAPHSPPPPPPRITLVISGSD